MIVGEVGYVYVLNDTQSGYTSGASYSHTVFLLKGPNQSFSVHCGLSAVQARRDEPCGAFVGVSPGSTAIPRPEDWKQTLYQAPARLTFSAIAYHGFVKAWSIVQIWE